MRRFFRVFAMCVLVLAVGAFGINDLNALCGNPGMVAASAFGGGTYYVVLFNPLFPFNWTGTATAAIGAPVGDAQFAIWLEAISAVPTNFLRLGGPGAAVCGGCAVVPAAGPYAFCPGATFTIIYD
jgi:hypothetical protein